MGWSSPGGPTRTDRTRAALILWGGWLLVTGATFSLGEGIIHPYYTVALAPAIGAVVGIGAVTLWSAAATSPARIGLAATVAVTAWWATELLSRTPNWNPWLRPLYHRRRIVAIAGCARRRSLGRRVARRRRGRRARRRAGRSGGLSIATAATPHTGSIPSAGTVDAGLGGGGGSGGGRRRARLAPGAAHGGPPGLGNGTGGRHGTAGRHGTRPDTAARRRRRRRPPQRQHVRTPS